MSGLYPCMHTSKEKVGITDYTSPFRLLTRQHICPCVASEMEAFSSSFWLCLKLHGQNKRDKNRVKSGNAVRLLWCKSNVKKLGYQGSEVRVRQDVAIIGDSKCVPMDSELEARERERDTNRRR